MYTSASGDIAFFVAALLTGAIIAFLYDLIRISRRIVPIGVSAVGIQDILFLGAAATILFYTAYLKNHGEIRWQGALGCGLGLAAYWLLIRNRFVAFGTVFVRWFIKSGLWLIKIVSFPLKIILKALKKPIDIIAWYTGVRFKKAKRIARCSGAKIKMRIASAKSLINKK